MTAKAKMDTLLTTILTRRRAAESGVIAMTRRRPAVFRRRLLPLPVSGAGKGQYVIAVDR